MDRGVDRADTAPHITPEDEVRELRAEVARLRAQLSAESGTNSQTYDRQPFSGARLMGLTSDRNRIRPASDFPELPQPTTSVEQLISDFRRWGYALLADAMSPQQIAVQVERMLDQAAAERAARVAHMSHHGSAQLVFNLVAKGQAFRDLVSLEPHAADGAEVVETLLGKFLGDGFYLGTAHGSIVGQGGGRQELHQDQGFVPLPHPPYPLYCLIIWTYSPFSLEDGGTYIVPGSHCDEHGANRIVPGVEFEKLAEERLVALDAPPGTCVFTDSRLLHSGGKRTAPGQRLASRILYCRGMMRSQENLLANVPREIVESASPRLKRLLGFQSYYGLGMVEGNAIDPAWPRVPVGELSLSDPQGLTADFDWKYSEDARRLASRDWDDASEYLGDTPPDSD